MSNKTDDTSGSKIDMLRRREAALKAAIAQERVRQQKRKDKDAERLHLIVGEALVRDSEDSPEFKAMLVRILVGANLSSSERAFLGRKGWL